MQQSAERSSVVNSVPTPPVVPSFPTPSSPYPSTGHHEQPPDLIADLTSHRPIATQDQQNLHLVPCTWKEVLGLDSPPFGYYDYVGGLVYCTSMATKDHNQLNDACKTSLECKHSNVYVYVTPSLQVISEDGTKKKSRPKRRKSKRNGASSSTQETSGASSSSHHGDDDGSSDEEEVDPKFGLRHPDFVISKTRPGSTGSTTSSRNDDDRTGEKTVEWELPYPSKFLAVGEITSRSTRNVDMYTKWAAYARSGVPLYIILDRGMKTYPKQVIVGSLQQFEPGLEKKTHGDPNPSKKRHPIPTEGPKYYRKVYRPQDKVDCPYFDKLNLTAADLLDMDFMRKLSKKLFHDRAGQRELAEREKKGRMEEHERANKADERAEREKKGRMEEHERANKADERANKADERANKAEAELAKLRKQLGKSKVSKDTPSEGTGAASSSGKSPKKSPKKGAASSSGKSPTKSPEKGAASSSGKSPTKSPEHKKSRKDSKS